MTNGEILKWNRRQQKLSQAELADILGMSTQMIGKYERDHTTWATMRDETVDKITAWIESVGGWGLKLDKKKTGSGTYRHRASRRFYRYRR